MCRIEMSWEAVRIRGFEKTSSVRKMSLDRMSVRTYNPRLDTNLEFHE